MNHLNAFPKSEKSLDFGAGWGISLLVNPDFYCCHIDEKCPAYLRLQSSRVERAAASGKLHNFETLSSWTSPLPSFLQGFYVHNRVCVRSRLLPK